MFETTLHCCLISALFLPYACSVKQAGEPTLPPTYVEVPYADLVLAAIGGGHFLPDAWLHRKRLYLILGVAISAGAFGLQLALRSGAFPYVLLYMSAVYWLMAPLVYRRAVPRSSPTRRTISPRQPPRISIPLIRIHTRRCK
jgi:hypothetical protein